MSTHEHFEELCAAASVGQASAVELFELEQHAADCEDCRRTYRNYLNFVGAQCAKREDNPRLSSQEAQECLNSELFTRRFFERAEKEGIVFSPEVGHEAIKLAPQPTIVPRHLLRRPAFALAATIAITATVSAAYFYGKGALQAARSALPPQANTGAQIQAPTVALNQRIAELTDVNVALQTEMDGLKAQLHRANAHLSASGMELQSVSEDRQALELQRDALDARLLSLQQDLSDSQGAISKAQQEATRLQEHSGDLENTLVADQVKIADLTDELKDKSAALDKERQLLAVRHDVTDLMGARNLHIVDVVDTDLRGKTRPAFGRIFFTEGKSLLFYAYDLNEAKLQKANYQYKVWARKEGQEKQVRSLGIFYSDDRAQRRWTFKCDDPKILADIDSVFVTLEPEKGDPLHPHGPNLMYAYLRGQANHP